MPNLELEEEKESGEEKSSIVDVKVGSFFNILRDEMDQMEIGKEYEVDENFITEWDTVKKNKIIIKKDEEEEKEEDNFISKLPFHGGLVGFLELDGPRGALFSGLFATLCFFTISETSIQFR